MNRFYDKKMSRINNLRIDKYKITESKSVDFYCYEDDNGSTKVIKEGDVYYCIEDNTAVWSVMDEMTIEIWNENVEKGIENLLFTDYKSVSEYWGEVKETDNLNKRGMTESNVYGVLIDPIKGVTIQDFNIEVISLDDMYSAIGCDYVELSKLTDELDLWVDEEGFVNGASSRIGVFQVQDADGERIGQPMYAGRGLILTSDNEGSIIGLTKKRAEAIVDSLMFQTSMSL